MKKNEPNYENRKLIYKIFAATAILTMLLSCLALGACDSPSSDTSDDPQSSKVTSYGTQNSEPSSAPGTDTPGTDSASDSQTAPPNDTADTSDATKAPDTTKSPDTTKAPETTAPDTSETEHPSDTESSEDTGSAIPPDTSEPEDTSNEPIELLPYEQIIPSVDLPSLSVGEGNVYVANAQTISDEVTV